MDLFCIHFLIILLITNKSNINFLWNNPKKITAVY